MITDSQCVAVYRRHLNLKMAADELGVTFQWLYKILKKAGEPVVSDKAKYGSERDQFAARSEALFQSIVPMAVDQNKKNYQSKYDFEVCGQKIDVKASMPRSHHHSSKTKGWAFSIKKQRLICDALVCLAFDDHEKLQHILLIPGDIIRNHSTIRLPGTGVGKWYDFEVNENELIEFFS